jgi:hypothetical protein
MPCSPGRHVYAERIARVGTPKVKATWQPNGIQIEVNTARESLSWQGYFNKKVKEFGDYAVYNYSGVDRDGITSFAASEDLERVVKVIDIALEYANDNYEGLGGSATQSIKLQRPRSDKPTSTNARRSSPSRMTPERNRRPRSGNEKRPSRRI